MRIPAKTWSIFLSLALLGALAWFKLGYPYFTHIDLSVDRHQALKIAEHHLTEKHSVDVSDYHHAIVFVIDQTADAYLQRTLGFEGEQEFLEKYDFELFFWLVRLFKEKEKEEFLLTISCKTGEVTAFRHVIEETARRTKIEREEAKTRVTHFLTEKFGFDPQHHVLKSEFSRELDNRTDHTFAWERKGVYIAWKDDAEKGGAKLITGATISGEDILSFSKFNLELPDEYNRDISEQYGTGLNLLVITRILYLGLFIAATFYLILRRNHLAMTTTRKFYYSLAASLFLFAVLSEFNEIQSFILKYDTTQPIGSFFGRHAVETILAILLTTVGILMPSLSGEALRVEIFPHKKEGSFLHYIRTSFFTRKTAQLILLGYLFCIILLGLQAALFKFGDQYFNLWFEQTWVTQLSAAYFPFFAAFYLGFRASLWEEIMFRMFAIGWLTKVFKRTFLAVIISSLIWGLGHSGYLIFPMWFRAVEVSCMGLLLAVLYLRFGLIPVIVAHYLFDVFWYGSGYLLGKTQPGYLYSLLFVLFLPLLIAALGFIVNKPDDEKDLRWNLNKHQLYNLEVLKYYLRNPDHVRNKSIDEVKKEIIKHGWDVAVVDLALEDLRKEPS